MTPDDRVTARRIVWFCLSIVPLAVLIGGALPFMFWGCSVSQHYIGSNLPKAWRTNEISSGLNR